MIKKSKIFFLVLLFFTKFTDIYSFETTITASHFRNEVNSLAKIMDASSELLFVKSDSVDFDGTSDSWIYCYTSADLLQYYYFHTNYDSVSFDSTSNNIFVGISYISENWIDSDSALFLAELQGGSDFRALNPDYSISAVLSRGTSALNPPPEWIINYTSKENPNNSKTIIIDATNNLPTSVLDLKDEVNQPEILTLYQNYPNPFNPSTTFSYKLSNSGEIEFALFNPLGQKIKTLFKGFQHKGVYQISFNAGNLAAGIYIYQIKLDNQFQRRKLLLLK